MIGNGLEMSLQVRYFHIGPYRQQLALENCFFVHRWAAEGIPYTLYTVKDLQNIHRGFGHPSVRAAQKLLQKASTEPIRK